MLQSVRAAQQKPGFLSDIVFGDGDKGGDARFRGQQIVTSRVHLLRFNIEADRQQLALIQKKAKIHLIRKLARVFGNLPKVLNQGRGHSHELPEAALQGVDRGIPAGRSNGQPSAGAKKVHQ